MSESAFAASVREARAAGRPLINLTISNPTVCGFHYDAEALLAPLLDPVAFSYDPDPRGLRSARDAVVEYYSFHEAAVSPDDLMLTTSSSEGYSFLFRLLCDPGDEVLVAQPSYPLFDFLADLDDVKLKPYPLFYDYGWHIDFAALEQSIGPRTRAVVVVHPNNPTGHATKAAERARLEEICVRHNLALIVDEVFLDYPLEAEAAMQSFAQGSHPVLTFVLSGMSKIAGLPQMKASWIATLGPGEAKRKALERLEVIADTFLSMNAPVQLALPSWLAGRRTMQAQILQRVRHNLAALRASGVEALKAEAGWCAILRLPQTGRDAAGELLRQTGVMVHPGSFYAIAETGRVVVSLLGLEAEFAEAVRRIATASCEPR